MILISTHDSVDKNRNIKFEISGEIYVIWGYVYYVMKGAPLFSY